MENKSLLFDQIAKGDVVAFKELYREYYPIVYLTALTYGRNEQLAEDVAQQIFLSVWERRTELGAVVNPGGWLHQSVRFQIATALKKEWRRREYIQNLKEDSDGYAENPDSKSIEQQRRRMLDHAIAQLPPRQQQVVRLSRLEGFTYHQIAEELGIGRETVKEHLARALRSLRVSLKDNYWAVLWLIQKIFW